MARLTTRRVMLAKEAKPAPRLSQAGGKMKLMQLLKAKPRAKVCIIRSVGGVGDIIMTTPIVRQLKEEFPECTMTYATDRHTTDEDVYYQLLKNASFVDNIVDARYVDRSKYDGVVDISSVCIRHENSNQSLLNRIDIFARACGVNHLKNPVPFYKVEDSERVCAQTTVGPFKAEGRKTLLMHTASFDAKRTWNPKRQNEFLKLISEARPDIQVLLSDFNRIISNKKQYPVQLVSGSIRDLAALINECDLFLGPDSGPMHLAGALKKRSIVLFGSIPPAARINYYKSHSAVVAEPKLNCLGCWYAACGINFKCMMDITAEQVLKKIQEIL